MGIEYKDYYKTLGVPRNASSDEIKKTYRKLARKYHPDVNKDRDAENKFKEIGEAYEVLGNSDKRSKYDSLGSNWQSGQEFRPPPGFEGFQYQYQSEPRRKTKFSFSGPEADFSDFFESLFGGGFRGTQFAGGHRGQDSEAEITISLRDAYFGAKKTISLQAVDVDENRQPRRNIRTLNIEIPPGTVSGARLRLRGQGGGGFGKASAGDLLLRIHIAPDPVFKLDGRDLMMELPLSPWEAALGTKTTIPTLDTNVNLKIPAGTQSGQKFRLSGKGLPGRGSKPTGNFYVITNIVIPKSLTAKEKLLFEQLSEVSKFRPR